MPQATPPDNTTPSGDAAINPVSDMYIPDFHNTIDKGNAALYCSNANDSCNLPHTIVLLVCNDELLLSVADLGEGLGGPGPPKNFSDEV